MFTVEMNLLTSVGGHVKWLWNLVLYIMNFFGLFLKGWKERICLRDKVMQYVGDIHKQIAPVLQTLQPTDVLRNVYAVLGYLVKHCAPVLFVQVLSKFKTCRYEFTCIYTFFLTCTKYMARATCITLPRQLVRRITLFFCQCCSTSCSYIWYLTISDAFHPYSPSQTALCPTSWQL